jgi:hypothetical protein
MEPSRGAGCLTGLIRDTTEQERYSAETARSIHHATSRRTRRNSFRPYRKNSSYGRIERWTRSPVPWAEAHSCCLRLPWDCVSNPPWVEERCADPRSDGSRPARRLDWLATAERVQYPETDETTAQIPDPQGDAALSASELMELMHLPEILNLPPVAGKLHGYLPGG